MTTQSVTLILEYTVYHTKISISLLGDVRGNVMKWELGQKDDDGSVVMDHVATLGDAVRGLYMDRWSLTAVAYDGSCSLWDFWL